MSGEQDKGAVSEMSRAPNFERRFFMADNETLKLIRMNEVEAEEIKWLWYPYIPFGKITVI